MGVGFFFFYPSPSGLKKTGQLIGKPTDRAPKRPTNEEENSILSKGILIHHLHT